ncbi:hypothetical protein [Polaribacter tangerinus]|uniref:hypothetical protein n=1 Tax=Polaribacter tangerinus TaxID=1920034 RepID=UPI000B4B7C5E|nr:hypothetical protein [Polaribacter tangerinus]
MKNSLKKLAIVVLMLGTLVNYANEKSTSILEGKKIKITYKYVKAGNTLSIKNENGTTLYKLEIKKTGVFSKIYDFSSLNDGKYYTELEKDYEIITKNFAIKSNAIVSLEEDTVTFKPVIRTENNLILISKIDFHKTPISLTIYYNDDTIYSEKIIDSEDILNRIYQVSKDKKGSYRVVLNSNNRLYTKEFKI